MDVNRAFSAPFEDPKWVTKAALGGLWTLLGITSPALYGYYLDYIRQVARGSDRPLPEWSDFGRLWVRGFLYTIALIVYMLPALVLWGIGFVPLIGTAIAEGEPGAAAAGSICLFGLLGTVWALAVSVLFYGAAVNYAMRDTFGSMFALGEILQRIRSVPGYFQAWLVSLVAFFAAGAIGGIVGSALAATGILAFAATFVGGFTGFLAQVMSGHVFGQWAAAAYGAGTPVAGGPAAPASGTFAPPPASPAAPPAPDAGQAPPPPGNEPPA